MNGVFTISLDFELHWGGCEKWEITVAGSQSPVSNQLQEARSYNKYFLNTRKVIPQLLDVFKQHEVHVTWAAVGMLLHENKAALLANAPTLKPSYQEKALSAYHYIDTIGIGDDEADDPFHFASSLVKQIIDTPHQELGTHTFAHYYCNEAGQTVEQFHEDLKAAQRVTKKYGCTLKSLVFPRNQFNDQYLQACSQEGITSVRSNPLDWFWQIESTQEESKWKRLNRGLDAYFPIGKKNTYRWEEILVRQGYPVCIPASRLLRPYRPKELMLNQFKIQRIIGEMTRAAKQNEVYHLWWHPHNFGHYPVESMLALQHILEHFKHLHHRYGMESCSMGELTHKIMSNKR